MVVSENAQVMDVAHTVGDLMNAGGVQQAADRVRDFVDSDQVQNLTNQVKDRGGQCVESELPLLQTVSQKRWNVQVVPRRLDGACRANVLCSFISADSLATNEWLRNSHDEFSE